MTLAKDVLTRRCPRACISAIDDDGDRTERVAKRHEKHGHEKVGHSRKGEAKTHNNKKFFFWCECVCVNQIGVSPTESQCKPKRNVPTVFLFSPRNSCITRGR